MPIKPENKARYPDNWPEIRAAMLKREGNRCRLCFLPNHAMGYRDQGGAFIFLADEDEAFATGRLRPGAKQIKIVLTIAHLDQQPENNEPWNLAALCQRCHNLIDYPHRRRNADATRRGKVNQGVFSEPEKVRP